MRNNLKELGADKRYTFTATIGKKGGKKGYNGKIEETILLLHVKQGAKYVAHHLWFQYGKQFSDLDLKIGDEISFDARVTIYVKGYFGKNIDVYKPMSVDYALQYPSNIKKVHKEP